MEPSAPSRTAWAAATHRATHQVVDRGAVFADPLAVAILDADPAELAARAAAEPWQRVMRFFIAARARVAEEALAESIAARGVRQLVVLGAGFDTLAYRHGFGADLAMFEVDHPATQIWKRQRLAEAGIAEPPQLRFVAVDFERDRLLDRLAASGFDPMARSFFLWLGVVPYLGEAAIRATLDMIGGLPGGGEVAFDYADPPDTLPPDQRARHEARAARVAALGEPFLSYFDPPDLHAQLRATGLTHVEDLDPRALVERITRKPAPQVDRRGGHVVVARTG